MKHLKQKLNSQRGASIFLALMLFLVCFMVASVILSSATANADKIRQRDENQREALAISSAADLIREVLAGTEYKGWETNTVYDCFGERLSIRPAKHEDKAECCTEMTYTDNEDDKDIAREAISAMVYEAFTAHTKYVPYKIVDDVLNKSMVISAEGMETVNVSMELDRDTYELTCILTIDGNPDNSNAVTLLFKPSVVAPEKNDAVKTVDADGDKDHQRLEEKNYSDGTQHSEWVDHSYDITTYTLNTSVKYGTATVSKGVSS